MLRELADADGVGLAVFGSGAFCGCRIGGGTACKAFLSINSAADTLHWRNGAMALHASIKEGK